MNVKTVILWIAIFPCLGWIPLMAQQAVLSGNATAAGSGGSAAWSVGQVSYITLTGSNGITTEGVQQPYEILFLPGVEEKGISLSIKVSPNPATTYAKLSLEGQQTEGLSYRLYDLQGILLLDERITGSESLIPMEGLTPSTYVLIVTEQSKPIITFKIIKR